MLGPENLERLYREEDRHFLSAVKQHALFAGALAVVYFLVTRYQTPEELQGTPLNPHRWKHDGTQPVVDKTPYGNIPWQTPHTVPVDPYDII